MDLLEEIKMVRRAKTIGPPLLDRFLDILEHLYKSEKELKERVEELEKPSFVERLMAKKEKARGDG